MSTDNEAIHKRLNELRQRSICSDSWDADEQLYIKLELIDIITAIQEQGEMTNNEDMRALDINLSDEAIAIARQYFKQVGIEAAFFDDVAGLACKEIIRLREKSAQVDGLEAEIEYNRRFFSLGDKEQRVAGLVKPLEEMMSCIASGGIKSFPIRNGQTEWDWHNEWAYHTEQALKQFSATEI